MKMMRIAAVLAALALGLTGPTRATTTTVTTDTYTVGSTSADIALSCKELSIGASDGVVSGGCNRSDGVVFGSSVDLDDLVKCALGATEGSAVIVWATAGLPGHTIGSWSVSLDSTGDDYIVTAKCRRGGRVYDASSLDLGDTTDGLKNERGKLKSR